MCDVLIELVAEIDAATKETTEVFASVESIGQKEFFEAAQTGFKPDYKFVLWQSDYEGQTIVNYNGARYIVYRTYARADEKIELYVTTKIGKSHG